MYPLRKCPYRHSTHYLKSQTKQQYGTKITCTEVRGKKKYGKLKFDFKNRGIWGGGGRGGGGGWFINFFFFVGYWRWLSFALVRPNSEPEAVSAGRDVFL